MSVLRLCLWSGPRNVSTALMYSFAQRQDTRVVDEPLYAHYLRVSGALHPGREEVLEAQDSDGSAVVREVVLGPCDRPVLFMKHMAHHLIELDLEFLTETVNVLLIRHPADVLRTLPVQLPRLALYDTGLPKQVEMLERLESLGQDTLVLDSRELLLDPPAVLAELCRRVGLEPSSAMLSWPVGSRPEDGVWAPHWYKNVHRSSGFAPYRPKTEPFPAALEPLLGQCLPLYEQLYERALRAPMPSASGRTASEEIED